MIDVEKGSEIEMLFKSEDASLELRVVNYEFPVKAHT